MRIYDSKIFDSENNFILRRQVMNEIKNFPGFLKFVFILHIFITARFCLLRKFSDHRSKCNAELTEETKNLGGLFDRFLMFISPQWLICPTEGNVEISTYT